MSGGIVKCPLTLSALASFLHLFLFLRPLHDHDMLSMGLTLVLPSGLACSTAKRGTKRIWRSTMGKRMQRPCATYEAHPAEVNGRRRLRLGHSSQLIILHGELVKLGCVPVFTETGQQLLVAFYAIKVLPFGIGVIQLTACAHNAKREES